MKKTPLAAFSRPRTSGIIAVDLRDDDRLVGVALTDGEREIMLCHQRRQGDPLPRGRSAPDGPRGRRRARHHARRPASELIALIVVGEGHVLTASANGYGKLTPLEDFPAHGRGGQGVIALQTSDRNGVTVAALQVDGRAGDHADQLHRHAGAHAGGRDLRAWAATPRACA